MIPVQTLPLKEDISDDCKDDERNAFLYDLELYEVERTSVIYKTDTVGGYLTAIFKEGYSPTEGDNSNEWPAPHSKGRQLIGVAKVLSTISGTPFL